MAIQETMQTQTESFERWLRCLTKRVSNRMLFELRDRGIEWFPGQLYVTEAARSFDADEWVFTFVASILAREDTQREAIVDSEIVPVTWRDHIKHAYKHRIPAWWLRRWPIRYRIIYTKNLYRARVCPHFGIPSTDRIHVAWTAGVKSDRFGF